MSRWLRNTAPAGLSATEHGSYTHLCGSNRERGLVDVITHLISVLFIDLQHRAPCQRASGGAGGVVCQIHVTRCRGREQGHMGTPQSAAITTAYTCRQQTCNYLIVWHACVPCCTMPNCFRTMTCAWHTSAPRRATCASCKVMQDFMRRTAVHHHCNQTCDCSAKTHLCPCRKTHRIVSAVVLNLKLHCCSLQRLECVLNRRATEPTGPRATVLLLPSPRVQC